MFPKLKSQFMLDPEITFLNHGSYGSCPKPIFENLVYWQKKLEKEPVKFLAYDIYKNLENSRNALSQYIGCFKDDIVFFPNPSTALNTVIKSLDLKQGDEILTTDHEYGALDKTWNFICKKTGSKYIKTKIPLPYTSKKDFINTFEKNITKNTKVIFISHITSSSALILPAKEISQLAKEYNIFCIIDGAHAPAFIDLNINDIDSDVYVGACHKWMCAPKGVSFLHVKKEYQEQLDPLVISWGYDAEQPSHSKFLDYHQWQGTNDISAYLTIPDTVKYLNQNNWNKVREQCRKINLWARNEINALLKKEELCDEKFLGQMSSMYIDYKDPIEFQINFYKKYKIQIPVTVLENKRFIRISIQAYNTKDDVYKLLNALENEFL